MYFVVVACVLVVSKLLSELSAPSLVATVVVVAVFVLAALPPFRGLSDLNKIIKMNRITTPISTFIKSGVFTVGFFFFGVFFATFLFGADSLLLVTGLLCALSLRTGTGVILLFLGE